MHTYTINTHTIRGEPVSVTAPIIGYHQKTGAAVPGIKATTERKIRQ